MKILIIEDDLEISTFLKNALKSQLFVVDCTSDGQEGSFLARTNDYDLIVLDYNLPTLNGQEALKEIRETSKVPIMVLTVRSSIEDKTKMFELGADDYLVKPFNFKEFILRVNALLRRPKKVEETILKYSAISINKRTKVVKKGEKHLKLTNKEYNLLEFFLRQPKRIFSRVEIMENVWDRNGDPFSNSLEAHVMNLRKKLNRENIYNYIQTVNGRGYKLDHREA